MNPRRFQPDETNLEAILGALPQIILVLDSAGRIQYMNRAEPGYRPSDFIGQLADNLIPHDPDFVFDDALRAMLDSGEPGEYDVRVTLPDGFDAWYRTRMTPFGEDEDGPLVLLVSRNITELKESEEKADRLRTLLPVCAWCDRIQDEAGNWSTLESYLSEHTGTSVSHGICPVCSSREMDGMLQPRDGRRG